MLIYNFIIHLILCTSKNCFLFCSCINRCAGVVARWRRSLVSSHLSRRAPASWIIASFIKFSGTKLREFLIENKLRRDSLIWISILRIKCGFMFSFRCFFSLCYAKQRSTLFRYYNTLYFWVKDSFEVKLSCINYFIFTVLF